MAFVINPYTIPSFFAGIISLILGFYVLYKNPKERLTQVFFILMLACALWSLTPLIVQTQPTSADALIWAKLSNTGLLIIPISLFHFTFIFHRKKPVRFMKIVWIYIIVIIMIILLLGSNLFFTMAEDKLIDGDGVESSGRGDGNYIEENYKSIPRASREKMYFGDSNDDGYYTIINETDEPLKFNEQFIIGSKDYNGNWISIQNTTDYYLFWYVDSNDDGEYTPGESIYYENGDGDQKRVYSYQQGPLYLLLLLFFFGFIIASIINLFYFYKKEAVENIKKPVRYLIFGLIAIIAFILSQYLLVYISPWVIIFFDSAITLMISIFFTVAVLKYDIVDLKLIIRKSVFYSTASLIVVVIFVIVEEVMEMIFSEIAFSGSVFSGIIAAFAALIIFSSVKKGLKTQVDKFFPSIKYMDKEYLSRINAYKATLLAMLADGKISPKEKSAITILRDNLNISTNEHKKLVQDVKSELKLNI